MVYIKGSQRLPQLRAFFYWAARSNSRIRAKYRAAGHLYEYFNAYKQALLKRALKLWRPGYFRHALMPIAKKLEMTGYRLMKGTINRVRINIIQMKISSNNSMWRWKVANTERKLYNTLREKTLHVFGVFKIM